MRIIVVLCVFLLSFLNIAIAVQKVQFDSLSNKMPLEDTSKVLMKKQPTKSKGLQSISVPVKSNFPANSLQQYLKGNVAGLFATEASGEPGTYQHMFIHGTSTPLITQEDVLKTQPLVVIDGSPVLSSENPYTYDIQRPDYSFNRIGPSTNLLAGLNIADIESVEVLKDLSKTAIYGPRGANGVIYIRTRAGSTTSNMSFNSSFGVAAKPSITTLNGGYEDSFRQRFYSRYANPAQLQSYPGFLRDSITTKYYGESSWADAYYKNALMYNADALMSGGSKRATFKFNVGTQKSSGNADETFLNKYYTAIDLNIIPRSWIVVSANIKGTRLDRNRNRYNRDRLAEVGYLPDLTEAPAPNINSYNSFIDEFKKGFDKNYNNIANGFLNVAIKLPFDINYNTRFGVSYNEGGRDLFYPSTLLDNSNYASNYFGLSQRLVYDNSLNYKIDLKSKHSFDFSVGSSIQWDKDRYTYSYAYKGVSDYLKVNLLKAGNFNSNGAFKDQLTFKFLDQTATNLVSFYTATSYKFKDFYSASLLLRTDGASNMQPVHRWFFSPVLSGAWDIKKHKLSKSPVISALTLRASVGRIGIAQLTDRISLGTQYASEAGWTNELRIPSYLNTATLMRSYLYGYLGYDIPWSYNEQLSTGASFGFFKNRIVGELSFYSTTTKNQLINIPGAAEYGYSGLFQSGMDINNKGVDLFLSADILKSASKKGFNWNSSINLNFNRNTLKTLPGGLSEIIIGDRKLKVGQAVDQFWVLKNNGIYNADDEVPVNPATGNKMTYKGTELKAGDPKWADINGDYNVDDKDKILTGNILPAVSGGWNNSLKYKKWDLQTSFYFNLGRKVLNQNMANRFNFINLEAENSINSVKEFTFWQEQGNAALYPTYNPWSPVIPYRSEQDLFLENASFLKLRSISLGFDLTDKLLASNKKATRFKSFYVFVSASNLFTITSYSGRDPELVNTSGIDTGYGLSLPTMFAAGLKVDFK
ncbi:SusC/RagA family TonB-linked outer membrane protein [Pedobacter sp. R-06]|uniref:SusC/RagA family TonB-linked outer membrane protein n=1 Tax=Pedobacter sp. R-06 TaxID=3404051 RepID=UPI003CF91716